MFHIGDVQRPERARPASTGDCTVVCSFGARGAGATPSVPGAEVAAASPEAAGSVDAAGSGVVAGAGTFVDGAVAGVPATSQPFTNELFVTHTGVYKGSVLENVFAVASYLELNAGCCPWFARSLRSTHFEAAKSFAAAAACAAVL